MKVDPELIFVVLGCVMFLCIVGLVITLAQKKKLVREMNMPIKKTQLKRGSSNSS